MAIGQNGHGRYGANGNGSHDRAAAHDSASERLRRLYRLQATRGKRAPLTRRSASTPLIVGSGLLVAMVGVLFLGIFTLVQATNTAYNLLTRDLPSLSKINDRSTFKTAQIFDRTGQLLWEFYSPEGGRRTVIPLSEMSQNIIDAQLAAEDAYFYQHQGVDLRATLRSAFFASSGTSRGGASTITQQLVRQVLLDPQEAKQVTIQRKLREIILAYRISDKLSKDQILEMYLNEVYYGNLSYGVEAAAQSYFNKPARDVTLAEAALLAGLVQSPSNYDPTRRDLPRTADGIPLPTKERQAYVLEQMARNGFITEQQARDAYAEKLTIKERQVELKSPHWVMYIRDLVEQKYGAKMLYEGGLKIYTTLDQAYNEKMLETVRNSKPNIDRLGGNNAAIMAANPKTGEILAFQGSMDYNDPSIDGQVNVLLSERQPGSSIKPLVYSSAFLKGWSPATFVDDQPTCWTPGPGQRWCPVNFDNRFHGRTTLRSALGNSLNIPAVKTLEYAGIEPTVELGKKIGLTTWQDNSDKYFGLSLTLGGAEVRPFDLLQMYTTFANNGLKIPLVAITRIVDAEGNVIEDYKVPQGEQVLDPRAAYQVTSILSDPAAKLFTYGPNTPLVLKRPAASKTGTTDNYRDTWTAGYTPNLAIAVWVGNTGGAPMREVLSSMTAGKIWPEAMNASFEYLNLPVEDFVRPDGLVERQVCGDTLMRPGAPRCWNDLFFAESAPQQPTVVQPSARPPAAVVRRPAAQPTDEPAAPPPAPVQAAPTTPTPRPQPAAVQPAPARPTPAPARPTPVPARAAPTQPQAAPTAARQAPPPPPKPPRAAPTPKPQQPAPTR